MRARTTPRYSVGMFVELHATSWRSTFTQACVLLRHARGQGNIFSPLLADHEQDWQPYPVDPYSAICDDHTYNKYTYIHVKRILLHHRVKVN